MARNRTRNRRRTFQGTRAGVINGLWVPVLGERISINEIAINGYGFADPNDARNQVELFDILWEVGTIRPTTGSWLTMGGIDYASTEVEVSGEGLLIFRFEGTPADSNGTIFIAPFTQSLLLPGGFWPSGGRFPVGPV